MERNHNVTYKYIIDLFDTLAGKHKSINSFNCGFMDEADIKKLGLKDYPILYAEPLTADFDAGVLTYNFNIYLMDRISNEIGENDATAASGGAEFRIGRIDAFSELLEIMHDLINQFKQQLHPKSWVGYYYGTSTTKKLSIDLELPITAEPFTARFDNELTGWSATFQIQVNNTSNLCIIPQTAPS